MDNNKKSSKVYQEYEDMINGYKKKMDNVRIGNEYSSYSDEYKETEIQKFKDSILREQANYKERYEIALKEELADIKKLIDVEIPEILKLDLNFNIDDIKFLAEKYEGHYFASKILQEKVSENKFALVIAVPNYMMEIADTEKKISNVENRFTRTPMMDTSEAKIRSIMGLK